ncbi:phage tail assembly chaperone [Sphingomonas qilianensis]|uniref:Phage tail assembly chaperone n=1 Tax=Sphingomonas qilianensis TaxID=1736690 RepID=A0ABU9XTA4_9SPHN
MLFVERAGALAGFAGAFLGWAPDAFWGATPAELLAVVSALRGDAAAAPPDDATIARLREAFPDG